MADLKAPENAAPWRARVYRVIFEHDTPAGKAFDVLLIAAIIVSVAVVMADSVHSVNARFGSTFYRAEWVFTILFTIEYLFRLGVVDRPSHYAFSFYGLVDLFAVLPTYLSLLIPGGQYLIVIRILRVLRVFRVLKLAQYVGEAQLLRRALYASRFKIAVFLFTVLTVVVVVGSLLYLIEGAEAGFTSIPRGVYWAIVTLTTVGYGDIAPQTPFGQALAAVVMIMGYGIIAVPTGIFSVELAVAYGERREWRSSAAQRTCAQCGRRGHDADSAFCKWCGAPLEG
jgi:voltage-gated potassium channel